MNRIGRLARTLLMFVLGLGMAVPMQGAHNPAKFHLPEARDVEMGGALGEAYAQGIRRLGLPPYHSPIYLRSDFSFETNRVFVNYSGDISGRFIQIASLVSPRGQMTPATLPEVLKDITKYQKADGHFGREVDWNRPLEPENPNAVLLPIFWGNSRLLVGLLEAHRAFGREDCRAAAKRIGDFYIATSGRFLDPAREAEYRMTGTYAAGYVTDYFPGIEGLALLYQTTRDQRYLQQAERMAEFFKKFDALPIDHSHGNLVTHYGLLLLYELTGKAEYLERPLAQWQKALDGGFVWPMGGVGERFRTCSANDEGCSEADWLRLNLLLWKLTGQTRFLDCAERLLWNHYAMNRTANGGYGHHRFVCDADGPVLMEKQFTEAVWCCTFHGLLGMHTLKSYLVAGSEAPAEPTVFINFPVSFTASTQAGEQRLKVSVVAAEPTLGTIQCRVRIDAPESKDKTQPVRVRRPHWAENTSITDPQGRKLTAPEEGGYLKLSMHPGAAGEVSITFTAGPRVEDRRMHPVKLDPKGISRHPGVTLSIGPHLLLANVTKPRPVLVIRVSPEGKLQWPVSNGLLQVSGLAATDEEITKAAQANSFLPLTPWETTKRDSAAAFVFDLIAVPEKGF